MFKINEGCIDRIIRVIVGTILLTSFYFTGNLRLLIGVIPFITGIIGWCGIYSILGINTNKK